MYKIEQNTKDIKMDATKQKELETILESAFRHADNAGISSPIDLAQLGSIIRVVHDDFSFNDYGYDKLRPLLDDMPDVVEVEKDDSVYPPRYFASLREAINKDSSSAKKSVAVQTKKVATQEVFNSVLSAPQGKLEDSVQVIWIRWKELAELLPEKENWGDDYAILKNYINFTFYRLVSENKVKQNGMAFTFNTGLVDDRYQAIYAIIKKNNKDGAYKPWFLSAFFCEGENILGKELGSPPPMAAWYFKQPQDAIYDIEADEERLDWQHILEEHPDRLPYDFIDRFARGFEAKRCEGMYPIDRKQYCKSFAEYLKKDSFTYQLLMGIIKQAVGVAIKKVCSNYKTAVPVYYPKTNRVNLLLPLCLLSNENVDLALVVEKKTDIQTGKSFYQGHTIYPLDWAYSNARLIARPESSWLRE